MRKCAKNVLLVLVLISDVLFTGIIFGWSALQLMLENEHQYEELCKDGETLPCSKQLGRLNLAFTLATFVLGAASLPAGYFLDTCGPAASVLVAGVLQVTGLVMLAVSDSKTLDILVPSLIFLSIGGLLSMLSSFPLPFSFLDIKPEFWPASAAFLMVHPYLSNLSFSDQGGVLSAHNVARIRDCCCCGECPHRTSLDGSGEDDSKKVKLLRELDDSCADTQLDALIAMESDADKERPPVHMHDRTLGQQLQSFEFFTVLAFASMQMLRCNTYLNMQDNLLAFYGDDNDHELYTKIFGFMLPSGVIFVPLIDWSIDRLGLGGTLHFTNFLLGLSMAFFR